MGSKTFTPMKSTTLSNTHSSHDPVSTVLKRMRENTARQTPVPVVSEGPKIVIMILPKRGPVGNDPGHRSRHGVKCALREVARYTERLGAC